MAESKGCAKAFRSVTRGDPDSTCSPGRELSNMRDWVATLGGYFTRGRATRRSISKRETRNSAQNTRLASQSNFEFRVPRLLFLGGAGFGGGVGVFLGEALNAARGVHQLLLAGEEGVAI